MPTDFEKCIELMWDDIHKQQKSNEKWDKKYKQKRLEEFFKKNAIKKRKK